MLTTVIHAVLVYTPVHIKFSHYKRVLTWTSTHYEKLYNMGAQCTLSCRQGAGRAGTKSVRRESVLLCHMPHCWRGVGLCVGVRGESRREEGPFEDHVTVCSNNHRGDYRQEGKWE